MQIRLGLVNSGAVGKVTSIARRALVYWSGGIDTETVGRMPVVAWTTPRGSASIASTGGGAGDDQEKVEVGLVVDVEIVRCQRTGQTVNQGSAK